jgi:hypothetical protein
MTALYQFRVIVASEKPYPIDVVQDGIKDKVSELDVTTVSVELEAAGDLVRTVEDQWKANRKKEGA